MDVGFVRPLIAVALLVGGCALVERNEVPETGGATGAASPPLGAKERLGRLLFFDKSLSEPPGQACANCHAPQVAFADPETELPVSRGAIPGRFGNRNDMTVSYAAFVPPLHRDEQEGIWIGNLF